MGAETTHRTRKALLESVRTRAAETLDQSIESDKQDNPFLHGVPAILEGLRSGQTECRVYVRESFTQRRTSHPPPSMQFSCIHGIEELS